MSAITQLTEDFTGGTVGSAVSTDPTTIFDAATGPGAPSTVQTLDGMRCMRTAPGATDFRLYEAQYPQAATVWFGFYFTIDTAPTANTAIAVFYLGATKVADVRVLAGGTVIQLRSGNSGRWESAAVTPGVRHRLSLQIAPNATGTGTLRARLYEGALRDASAPTQDSGPQGAAVVAAGTDLVRFGAASADATLVWRMARLRGDNATEPAGIGTVNTAPSVRAEAVQFAALDEDFKGATAGTAVGTSNSIFDSSTGAGAASTFSTDSGLPAMRNAPGASDFRLYLADYAAQADLWLSFYFTLDAVPTGNTAIWAVYSGATKIADVQVMPSRQLRLRSVSSEVWTSTPIELGVRHRLVVRVKPAAGGTGVLVLELHEADLRDSATPTQTSGERVAGAAVASSNQVRFGTLSPDATLVYRISRLRASTTGFRPGVVPYTSFTLQAVATDPDAGAVIATHTWTQLSGPPVTLSGSGTGPRTAVAPAVMYGAVLIFGVTATDDKGAVSTQDYVAITALPWSHFDRVNGQWLPTRPRTKT